MVIKPSIVLAAAVLTAASFLAPFARAAASPTPTPTPAEPTYEMPPGTPFDPNPAARNSDTNKVLTYGSDSDNHKVPLKTLRITNNTNKTVYPIMRDTNDGPYDPYDDHLKEYRGYIGYQKGGKYYFGLEPGESILVSLPLVFWNAARISDRNRWPIFDGPDGRTQSQSPGYDPQAVRAIANAETSNDTIPNGVVMWYRADNRLASIPLPIARTSSRSGRFATTTT